MVVCPGPHPLCQFLHSNVSPQTLSACRYMELHFLATTEESSLGSFLAWLLKFLTLWCLAPRLFRLCGRSQSFPSFYRFCVFLAAGTKKAQKTRKKCVFRLKTRKCMLCDVMLLTHQRVHVLQVMGTVERGYGCLTGFCSLFQLFELCKTGTDDGESILHPSDGEVKLSAVVRRYPFLVETSARGEI